MCLIMVGMDESMCAICLEDVGNAETWNCGTCNASLHWDCCRRWWSCGAGCPQCRQCDFDDVLTPWIDTSALGTTAERVLYFRALVVGLMLSPAQMQNDPSDRHEQESEADQIEYAR